MTPPLVFALAGLFWRNLPPPSVLFGLMKLSDVLRGEFPMVPLGATLPIFSKLETALYVHGPGLWRRLSGLFGAVGHEPRKEFEGESSPKQDVRPSVEDLLGLVKREKRFEVENPPRSSSEPTIEPIICRLSTEIEEASVGEWLKVEDAFEYSRSTEWLRPWLRPCFLRGGGAYICCGY